MGGGCGKNKGEFADDELGVNVQLHVPWDLSLCLSFSIHFVYPIDILMWLVLVVRNLLHLILACDYVHLAKCKKNRLAGAKNGEL